MDQDDDFYCVNEASLLLQQQQPQKQQQPPVPAANSILTGQSQLLPYYSDEHSPEFIEHVCNQLQSSLLHTSAAANSKTSYKSTHSIAAKTAPPPTATFSTGTSTANNWNQTPSAAAATKPKTHHLPAAEKPKRRYNPKLSLSHESLILQNTELKLEQENVGGAVANRSAAAVPATLAEADQSCIPFYMRNITRSDQTQQQQQQTLPPYAAPDDHERFAVFSDRSEPQRLEKWFKKRKIDSSIIQLINIKAGWTDIEDLIKVKALSQLAGIP